MENRTADIIFGGKNPYHYLYIIIILTLVFQGLLSIDSFGVDNGSTTYFVGGSGLENYSTIQEAVNLANPGDTIFVFKGLYPGHIVINKPINLIGEDKQTTIITTLNPSHTILISSDYVTIANFTIKGNHSFYNASLKFSEGSYYNTITNCAILGNYYGIWMYTAKHNTIKNCTIYNNTVGIWVHHMSNFNTIHDCTISSNFESGIYFCCASAHNTMYHNNISFNLGIGARVDFFENTFYLNNFINNSKNAHSPSYKNFWDNGSRGNYWSDYDEESEGAYDNDSNGIVDSPHVLSRKQDGAKVDNHDRYPLIYPWRRDTVPRPRVSIASPHEGMLLNGTVIIMGTADDPRGSLMGVEVRFDQGSWIQAQGTKNWYYNWDTKTVDDGSHSISVRSFNGNQYSRIETISVSTQNIQDNIRPTVSITAPRTGEIISGNVQIQGGAADSDGIVEMVEIKTINSSWRVVNGTSTWYTLWNTHLINNGEYKIYVRSYDGEDYSSVLEITVTVFNNQLPQITIITPIDGEVVLDNVLIEGIASDIDGNDTLEKVQVRINNGEWLDANGTNTWSYHWHNLSPDMDEESFILYARAWDGHNYSLLDQITLFLESGGNQNDIPGFEFVVIFFALMFYIIYITRRN
jgi:parallel beta-helix repeat protein